MKILWVGDAVVSTGFSKCTHAVCDHLYSQGHEVHVLGMNYYGDPHQYPYLIYPAIQPLDQSRDFGGSQRLPKMIKKVQPDVVVILQDPWNIWSYTHEINQQLGDNYSGKLPKLVGWIAVDSENQIAAPDLNSLDHVIVWTEFAKKELEKSGCLTPISIVPCGVDTSIFKPYDKLESRTRYLPKSIDPSSFIIGYVGRNQQRKCLHLLIEYFSHWVNSYSVTDAYLFLHIAPTQEDYVNLHSLAKYHNLPDKRMIISTTTTINGLSDQDLAKVYSCFDLFMTCSQAEGWCLPALESMACGVPVLAPDCGGLASWARPGALLVPCSGYALTAPTGEAKYTVGGIMDKGKAVDRLHGLYMSLFLRQEFVEDGSKLSDTFTWTNAAQQFEQELINIVDKVKET